MVPMNTIDRLIDVLGTLKANVSTYQTEIGATAADITFINTALANLEYLRSYSEDVDAAKKGVFQIKDTAFRGDPTETVADFPVFAAGASPTPLVAGYLERVTNMIKRFMLGPGYNHDIGVALGFESAGGPSAPDPGTVKPTVEAFSAQTGYTAGLVISNRGEATLAYIFAMLTGTTQWFKVGDVEGKSGNITYTPTPAGQPVQMQVRAQMRKAGTDYGQVSDPVYVTLNP